MQTETLEAMSSTAYQMLMEKAAEKQELLEALKKMANAFRPPEYGSATDDYLMEYYPEFAIARAAIAKAEGGAA